MCQGKTVAQDTVRTSLMIFNSLFFFNTSQFFTALVLKVLVLNVQTLHLIFYCVYNVLLLQKL